jgi:hypothetical protein
MRWNSTWIILLALFCITSCKKDNANYSLSPSDFDRVAATNIESFFGEHPSKETVIKIFGKPIVESTNANGYEVAVYEWDHPVGNIQTGWKNKLSGFQVEYSNNVAFGWDPAYSSFEVKKSDSLINIQKTSASKSTAHPKLLFYIVSPDRLPNGQYINTEKFKNLGYISSVPDFTILELKDVEYHLIQSSVNYTIQKEYTVEISLETNDAQRFETFTSNNIGSKILISLDEVPILAPYLATPISSGELGITGLSDTESSNLVYNLENIITK